VTAFKEHREDVSAVELTPDKHLWLGSDETKSLNAYLLLISIFITTLKLQILLSYQHRQARKLDIEGLTLAPLNGWLSTVGNKTKT